MFENFKKYEYPLYGLIRLPEVKVTKEEKLKVGLKENASNFEFLKALAKSNFDKIVPKQQRKEYSERGKYEFDVVNRLGFVDYYLLVWRVINFCDDNKYARGGGRGSCAGSLIFFLMGITDCDPIKYGLYFQRFISEIRAKIQVIDGITYIDGSLAPDVDIDISPLYRHKVVEFLQSLYPGRISKISSRSTLTSKILIKECTKIILNYEETEAKEISDLIPKEFGIVSELQEAREKEPKKSMILPVGCLH